MAKSPRVKRSRPVVYAQHTTRLNPDGSPAKKTFTKETWDLIPMIYYVDKAGVTKKAKGGWIEVGPSTGSTPPEPLKQAAPVEPGAPA